MLIGTLTLALISFMFVSHDRSHSNPIELCHLTHTLSATQYNTPFCIRCFHAHRYNPEPLAWLSTNCTRCPESSSTDFQGATSIGQCACNDEFYFAPEVISGQINQSR